MSRIRGRATAVGSVTALGILTVAIALISVSSAPGIALTTPRLTGARSSATTTCPPPPPQQAWASKVNAAGKIRWTIPLPTGSQDSEDNVEPVVVQGNAYVAQHAAITAIETSDGRSIWSWTGGQSMDGMWAWNGLLAVLTDQVSDHAQLTGLDDLTGVVRWQLSIPGAGLIGNPQATGDGRLAWLRADGVLQVVNLASGRVGWSKNEDRQAVPVVIDGLVLSGRNGVLHAFADKTGRLKWTVPNLSLSQHDQVLDGLVFVSSGVIGPSFPTAVTAVDPATGRVLWRFDLGTDSTVLSAGRAGLAVATYVPQRRLYLLDTRTGKVLWQANAAVAVDTIPIVLPHDIVSVEGGVEGYPEIRLVDRDTADGQQLWKVDLSGFPSAHRSCNWVPSLS